MLFAVTNEKSRASTNDLVTLIKRSQKLASRMLTIANSAAYGLEYKVSSLEQAVRILGIREIRLLVVLIGMAAMTQGTKLPDSFNLTELWKHQLKTAAIAKALATVLGGPAGRCGPSAGEESRLAMDPDTAYAAGLLHDIGKVFFAVGTPDLWREVEEVWEKGALKYFEIENNFLGMDHAFIGAGILHHWRLPLLLTEPINWHHEPELAQAYKMDARLVAVADHIAHSEFDAEGNLCAEVASLLPRGYDPAQIKSAVEKSIADTTAETLLAFV